MVGYFNTDLAAPEGQARDEEIVAAMAAAGLEYLSGHFLPRQKPWLKDSRTWCMRRKGKEIYSRNNYVLVTDFRLLHNLLVHDACQNMDH